MEALGSQPGPAARIAETPQECLIAAPCLLSVALIALLYWYLSSKIIPHQRISRTDETPQAANRVVGGVAGVVDCPLDEELQHRLMVISRSRLSLNVGLRGSTNTAI